MAKAKKKPDPNLVDEQDDHTLPLDAWIYESVPCKYARFKFAISPGKDREPVFEFKIESQDKRYLVDTLVYTPYGLVFKVNQETGIVPLGNITYVRVL